jgi:hypothetical protein
LGFGPSCYLYDPSHLEVRSNALPAIVNMWRDETLVYGLTSEIRRSRNTRHCVFRPYLQTSLRIHIVSFLWRSLPQCAPPGYSFDWKAPGAGATAVALAFDYFPDAHGEKHMARGICGRNCEQCVCGKRTFLFIVAREHEGDCEGDTHSGMVLPKPWWKLKSHADGGAVLLPIRRGINKTNDTLA